MFFSRFLSYVFVFFCRFFCQNVSRPPDEDGGSREDEAIGVVVPHRFRLHESGPAALDKYLMKRGELVRPTMGWFGGLITQERTKYVYELGWPIIARPARSRLFGIMRTPKLASSVIESAARSPTIQLLEYESCFIEKVEEAHLTSIRVNSKTCKNVC